MNGPDTASSDRARAATKLAAAVSIQLDQDGRFIWQLVGVLDTYES